MRATRVTSEEFQSDFGNLSDEARRQPVIVTQGGEDALVVVSVEEWARFSQRDRRVGAADDLPDRMVATPLLEAEVAGPNMLSRRRAGVSLP